MVREHREVFPVGAGVSRLDPEEVEYEVGLPRRCGGVPITEPFVCHSLESSP